MLKNNLRLCSPRRNFSEYAPFFCIVIDHGLGLPSVDLKTPLHNFFSVIVSLIQCASTSIAEPLYLRRVKLCM